MLQYRVTGSVQQITQHLRATERRHIPFAASLALNRTIDFVDRKEVEEIERKLDRPTPFTKRSTFVIPATKQRLVAELRIKDRGKRPPIKWLRAQIHGGARTHKAFEQSLIRSGHMQRAQYAVPTRAATLDGHGNVAGSEIKRILADLASKVGSRRRMRRPRGSSRSFYFVSQKDTHATRHLAPGIYLRQEVGFGAFGSVVKPIFVFTRRPRYSKRFDFYRVADLIGPMRWRIEFPLALRYALATSR